MITCYHYIKNSRMEHFRIEPQNFLKGTLEMSLLHIDLKTIEKQESTMTANDKFAYEKIGVFEDLADFKKQIVCY